MELLNSDKKHKEIAELAGVSLDVVKKISQMKNIREKFYLMDLNTDELEFLDDIWLDIVYLKDVDDKDDIKDIIQILKHLEAINKDNIELSIIAIECRDRNVEDLESKIMSLKFNIKSNKDEYNEVSKKLEEPRKVILTALDVINSYDNSVRELLYELVGIRKSWMDDSYKELCLRRSLDNKLFFKLKNKGVIDYYTSYTEITDLKAFLDAVLREPNIKLGYRMKYIQELSENVLDIELNEILNKRKELEEKKRDFKKELVEIKNLFPIDFLDEAIESKNKLEKNKEFILKKNKIEQEQLSRIKEELTKSITEEYIIIDNFIDIKNTNFLIYTKQKSIVFVAYSKYFYDTSYHKSQFIKNKLNDFLDINFKDIIRKASKCSDEIFIGFSYLSLEKVEPNRVLNLTDREKIEYEIYRKFNKEFLFL